uniref:Uncharacterized protein n=1 Tax=Rhizophora mucronata TaxID=61149 RepID=A0A2P2P7A5_RHIMU
MVHFCLQPLFLHSRPACVMCIIYT